MLRMFKGLGVTAETTEAAPVVKKASKKPTDFSHLKNKPQDLSVSDVNNLGLDYLKAMGKDEGLLQFHHNQKHAEDLRDYTPGADAQPTDHFTFLLGKLKTLLKAGSTGTLFNSIVNVFQLSFDLSKDLVNSKNKAIVLSGLQTEINTLKQKEKPSNALEVVVEDSPRPGRRN